MREEEHKSSQFACTASALSAAVSFAETPLLLLLGIHLNGFYYWVKCANRCLIKLPLNVLAFYCHLRFAYLSLIRFNAIGEANSRSMCVCVCV